MTNFRILFGWVPKTADYEAKQDALRQEYQELKAFQESKELAEYLELEKTVLSSDFARKKKAIAAQRYADTPEYRKEREYLALKKSRDIRRYYQMRDSVALKDFLEFENSYDVKHYHTLEKLINSDEFIRQRKSLGKKFRTTPEFEKLQEFKALKSSKRFRDYFAFKNSKDYVNFTLLIGSERIAGFEQLGKYIESETFRKVKEYMLLPGKQKLAISDEHKLEQRYLTLKQSDKFKWYFRVYKSRKYAEIKNWQLTFSDEFEAHKLDTSKWLTRYFWGETLLKDSYVNAGEKQFYTGEKNIEIASSVLKIRTQREKVNGKVWNPAMGFFTRDFNYTSAIINSGKSFRQQYGLFEAKVRFNRNFPVNHGIWLVSELMLPHVDLARAGKKISVGTYWGNPNVKGGVARKASSMSRDRYGFDYYIFSMEWTKDRLTWKVNGVPAGAASEGVPQVPMYLNINSSLYQDVDGAVLPAEMEVDWVRCYQRLTP
jgi:beta-glucanase (GH16 family)